MATSSTPSFLKSPDADEAARSSERPLDGASSKSGKRFPRWVLFCALGVLLISGIILCVLFLRHRGKTQLAKIASGSSSGIKPTQSRLPTEVVELPLDPFVVNLADAGGHSYARIGLTVSLATSAGADGNSEKKEGAPEAASPRDMMRDTIITVLNQEQSADLLAPGGKEHLKQAIRTAVTARDPQLKIADIYFTEFLIQQ